MAVKAGILGAAGSDTRTINGVHVTVWKSLDEIMVIKNLISAILNICSNLELLFILYN
ncbi:hypothetical protein DSBG_0030 [Desulfosporosinus sp. BG]|nr:hypothetical protein DSBG_0030 [Desulfosporosinus sp. BG]